MTKIDNLTSFTTVLKRHCTEVLLPVSPKVDAAMWKKISKITTAGLEPAEIVSEVAKTLWTGYATSGHEDLPDACQSIRDYVNKIVASSLCCLQDVAAENKELSEESFEIWFLDNHELVTKTFGIITEASFKDELCEAFKKTKVDEIKAKLPRDFRSKLTTTETEPGVEFWISFLACCGREPVSAKLAAFRSLRKQAAGRLILQELEQLYNEIAHLGKPSGSVPITIKEFKSKKKRSKVALLRDEVAQTSLNLWGRSALITIVLRPLFVNRKNTKIGNFATEVARHFEPQLRSMFRTERITPDIGFQSRVESLVVEQKVFELDEDGNYAPRDMENFAQLWQDEEDRPGHMGTVFHFVITDVPCKTFVKNQENNHGILHRLSQRGKVTYGRHALLSVNEEFVKDKYLHRHLSDDQMCSYQSLRVGVFLLRNLYRSFAGGAWPRLPHGVRDAERSCLLFNPGSSPDRTLNWIMDDLMFDLCHGRCHKDWEALKKAGGSRSKLCRRVEGQLKSARDGLRGFRNGLREQVEGN